jgi:hypothetical protein
MVYGVYLVLLTPDKSSTMCASKTDIRCSVLTSVFTSVLTADARCKQRRFGHLELVWIGRMLPNLQHVEWNLWQQTVKQRSKAFEWEIRSQVSRASE